MHQYRTHNCCELTKEDIGKEVKIAGWIHNVRDHGGVLFIDLRDHYGITQVVSNINHNEIKEVFEKISKETTVSITGVVEIRPLDMINKTLATGEIEVNATHVEILGKSKSMLPFDVNTEEHVREELRLKYRFLDLRRKTMHDNIILRSRVIQFIREKMIAQNFLEMQTPILTASSPEGARDYLVPSRVHPGKCYALPQAPQQFKQLYMTSGFDRYFQIAPCFRDEDARADRSPGEFYQLDMEMAFATQDDVFNIIEKVMVDVFSEFSEKKITQYPFIRIPYKEAMLRYGSDKPDLRNPLEIKDVTHIFDTLDFQAFKNKTVRIIAVPDCSTQPRKWFDRMVDFATQNGAKGLAWLKVNEELSLAGPIAKFINDDAQKKLIELTMAETGYALFFIADKKQIAEKLAGIIRTELGQQLNLIQEDVFEFCWIVDFPMFEYDNENKKIDFSHNPFSMPQGGMQALQTQDPLDILAYQYDIVCNGVELSSGAVRNHMPDAMIKAFEIAGYEKHVVEQKFPAMYNAFHYGAPPHAGIAPGIDRIVMLIADEPSIREVVAFPMNSKAQDVMMGAPSEVSDAQLSDINIKFDIEE
ncbi:MAG: aspartate--tRNA ligase [Clostridiales bacterium]|nr:aspartate--tRNA ligase [Clostridiales bacterium]